MKSYVKAKGKEFFFKQKPLKLRGFGIGSWLNIEHFMVGLPTSDKMIQEAFCEVLGPIGAKTMLEGFYEHFFGPEDLKLLRHFGVNFIRVPFNYRLLLDDNHSTVIKEGGFKYLDRLINLCEEYQMFLMLDLHTVPGGQNPDWHADNNLGVPLFWEYDVFRQEIIWLWGQIAKRYAECTYLMGYDLLNEPAFADWTILNNFYEQAIREIRKVDKNHTIILEGDMFSMNFNGLIPFQDENLAIGFHYYPTVWSPELLDEKIKRIDRKKHIAKGLDRIITQCKVFDWPLICGEFGYGKDCGDRGLINELLEDTLLLLEERNLNWTLWSYKDVGFMSMVRLKDNSIWKQLAKQISISWDQDIEKQQAERLLNEIRKQWCKDLTYEEAYRIQFRLRAINFSLQKNHILIPNLEKIPKRILLHIGEDFKLERCHIDPYYEALISKILLCD